MSRRSDRPNAPFTAPERDLLRRELCRHFGQDPLIADGIFLRTWRGGERRNQPKIPPAVQTMLARGLVDADRDPAAAWRVGAQMRKEGKPTSELRARRPWAGDYRRCRV